MDTPRWLEWAERLHAIAQTGLTYSLNHFDTERYEAIRQIAAELYAAGTGAGGIAPILDLLKRDTGYCTPKVDVRAAVFDGDRLLLVREREDGCWTLPGGWADIGDTPSHNVVREVREESGFEAQVIKLAAVYDCRLHGHPPVPFHAYKVFFVCRLVGGTAAHSSETDGVGFFAEDAIPELSQPRVRLAQIREMFDHYRHPERPTSFD